MMLLLPLYTHYQMASICFIHCVWLSSAFFNIIASTSRPAMQVQALHCPLLPMTTEETSTDAGSWLITQFCQVAMVLIPVCLFNLTFLFKPFSCFR